MTWSGLLTWTGLLLTGLFITLKLAAVGVVAVWPWWAVLLPVWATFAVVVLLGLAWEVGLHVRGRRRE